MTNYYRFERGLGKKEIGLAWRRCLKCRKSGVTLWGVDDGYGRRAFACKDCKNFYERRKK